MDAIIQSPVKTPCPYTGPQHDFDHLHDWHGFAPKPEAEPKETTTFKPMQTVVIPARAPVRHLTRTVTCRKCAMTVHMEIPE